MKAKPKYWSLTWKPRSRVDIDISDVAYSPSTTTSRRMSTTIVPQADHPTYLANNCLHSIKRTESMRVRNKALKIAHVNHISVWISRIKLNETLINSCGVFRLRWPSEASFYRNFFWSMTPKSFAVVIRVVAQRSSPLTAVHSSSAFLSLCCWEPITCM